MWEIAKGVDSGPAQRLIPASPPLTQRDSRPGGAEGEGQASHPAQYRGEARASRGARHTFPFGVSAGCAWEIKLRPSPGAGLKSREVCWVPRIPPLPSLQGWVKSLHFLELSFLICKTEQERGLSE